MTIALITIFFMCFSVVVRQPDSDSLSETSRATVFLDENDCSNSIANAKRDIAAESIKLFYGGFVIEYSSYDPIFQNKFNVEYINTGCDYSECYVEYNKLILEYLTKEYGPIWGMEIRKDVYGLSSK